MSMRKDGRQWLIENAEVFDLYRFYCEIWQTLGGSLAERVGFEPTVRSYRTPDFESGAFDHSATFPIALSVLQMPARADFKVLGTNLQLAVTMQAG